MCILVRFTNTSPTTTEQYDESVPRLRQVGDFPPDGMEYHVSFVADGNIQVSEIWEIARATQRIRGAPHPRLGGPEIFEIHNIIRR
jgi:hypothetical protein